MSKHGESERKKENILYESWSDKCEKIDTEESKYLDFVKNK